MIAITHIVLSLLLIELLSLDRNDAFVALVFGVFIDLDHLFGLREYVDSRGYKAVFDLHTLMNPGGHWKSALHTPIAAAIVAPVAAASRLAIPLLFWGLHILMDYVQEQYLGLFSSAEAVLLGLAACGLVTMRYARYIASGTATTLMEYLKLECDAARCMLRPGSTWTT